MPHPTLAKLIERLDEAVSTEGCCHKVKAILEDVIQSDHEFLDPSFLAPAPNSYARRLIHLDPQDRYSLMSMVWDKGQGTSLHDHAGMWCVECVYKGRIRVRSFRQIGEPEGDLYRFEPDETLYAGVGEAGALIPPLDHHILENPDDTPAVTLHVYAGEMNWCHAFVPTGDGRYRMEERKLCYTE